MAPKFLFSWHLLSPLQFPKTHTKMGSKSQILLNPQALLEDEEHEQASTQHQMEFFSFPSNFNVSHLPSIPQHQTLSPSTPFLHPNLSQTLNSSHFPTPHLLSLQTSTPNPWWVHSNLVFVFLFGLFLIWCVFLKGIWEEKWVSFGIGSINHEDEEDERKKKSERAKILIQDHDRCRCSWWWLQMAQVRSESRQKHTSS